MSKTLLVGATGKVGQLVTARLVEHGVRPLALVRDVTVGRARLGDGVDYVKGDLAHPASLEGVLDGVSEAYLAIGQTDQQVQLESNFIDAAARANVPRLVKISVTGSAPDAPTVFGRWHHSIETRLAEAAIPTTLIRPNLFMANLSGAAATIAAGQIHSITGDGRIAWIDEADIADVAVAALLDGRAHADQIYTLTGPEALTYEEVAARFTSVLGRDVTHTAIDDASFADSLIQGGLPAWIVEAFVETFSAVCTGFLADVTGDVATVLDRKPRSLTEWITNHAAAFTA